MVETSFVIQHLPEVPDVIPVVAPEHRRRGIGSALIAALKTEARRLGFTRMYTATDTADSLIERRGWRAFDEAATLRGSATVYALDL